MLQDSSRFLLTIGVGLFMAYLIFMLAANLFSIVYRPIKLLRSRSSPGAPTPPDFGLTADTTLEENAPATVTGLRQEVS